MKQEKHKILSPGLTLQVFYSIYAKRKLGIVVTGILLAANYLFINCFLYESLIGPIDYPYSIFDYIHVISRYFYMINYLDILPVAYSILRYIPAAFNLSYLALFLRMRILIKNKRQDRVNERIFEICNTYYAHILMVPLYDIMYRDLFCDRTVMIYYQQQCLVGSQIITFVFSLFGLISGLIMTALTVIYNLNGIYDKKNYLSGQNRVWEIMQAFVKVIVPLIAVLNKHNNHAYFIVYIVLNLLFALILLGYFMAFFPLNKFYSEAFTLVGLTLYLAQSAAHLAFIGSENDYINPTYLGVFFWPTILAGSYFVYNRLKTRLIMKTHAKNSAELIRQVQAILQLKRSEKILSDDEVFYRGLIIRHKASCTNLRCFCKSDELFDPKKGKDFEPAKWTNLKALILKYYVRFLFEQAIEAGGSDTELIISYAEFLFQKFRNTHLALFQITKLVNADKFIYPYYRFRIYKLQQKISSYIDARNLEALDKPLEIENVILIEEQLEKVIHGMKKIIMTSLGFWSYLYNKDIELEKLKALAEEMHYSVENTTKAWGPLKPYLYKQRRIMYYYNWFLKDILQKKIILSEEEVDDLFDSDVASVYSADFLNIIKDDNVIFQDDTAIVHMSGNSSQIGRILKTNRAANKLFKYSPQELNRSSVDILMPNMIAHKHNFYINSFIITGKSKVLYQQKRTFGKDKQGFIMPLWILVKQLNSPMGDVQYVGLLRPLSQKKDEHNYYMLLNNFGEINGITKSLAELLHLPPDLFQKIDVNVILLAPKLIKHFFFAKVLTSEKHQAHNASSVAFGGASGTNITSFASGGFGKKPGRFAGKISPFMGSIAQKSPLKVFHELDKMHEDVTEIHEEEGLEKPENESDLSFEDAQDLIDNKNGGIEVEFTLRIPKKLRTILKEFNALKSRHHDLLNNQQFLVNAIHQKSVNINSMMSEGGPPSSAPNSAGGSARKKLRMVGHFTNFKHAIDAYISALQHTAEKISKMGVNNVYRIRGVVVTDYYGPDRDVVKYIKIVEVVKKVERFSHMVESSTRSGTSKRASEVSDLSKSYGSFHASQTMRSQKKTPKSSFRPERPIEDIQVKSDDDNEGAKIYMKSEENVEDSPRAAPYSNNASSRNNLTNIRQQESLSMKEVRSKSEKEPEDSDEDKDDGGSNESEDRQAIMNELKNNILTHYQSIYQKEDNMMIDRNFTSLNNVKWFIIILFLMLVPLNIIIYLVGPFTTYKQLKKSVNNIYLNEDIRRNYMRCHNSFISILLNNQGTFDSLTSTNTDAYEYFNTYPSERLQSAYNDLISESTSDEWMIILYQYAPEVTQYTSVDYQGAFEGATVTVSHAIRRLQQTVQTIEAYTTSEYVGTDEDLTFFRVNSMEKFNKILGDATREIFNAIDDKFNSTENLSIYILIVEGLLFFFSFWIILRLILIVIRSLRESLAIFAAIDNKQIIETENYYKRLLEYLEVSNKQYITLDNGQGAYSLLTKKEEDLIKSTRRREEKKEGAGKKFKNIHSGRFLRNDTIRILTFYLISIVLCFLLSGLFHLMNKLSIDSIQSALSDSQKFIELSPTYVTTLVALKELTYNSTEYETYVLPYISDVLNEVSTVLGTSGYTSDLNFIKNTYMNVLSGNPCSIFKTDMENNQQYEDCVNLGFGRLALGLLTFHNYYKDIVSGALAMTDSQNYGQVDIEDIYEFGQLIRIIDDLIMEKLLISWKQDMDSYVNSKEELIAILIAIVSVLNVVVYFGARSGVVGTLQNRFLFYRKIYNEYMLAEAPIKEKRIKAVLVKYKLLNR